MSYTFQKAHGGNVGQSLVEDDYLDYAKDMMKKAEEKGVKMLIPIDTVVAKEFSNDSPSHVVEAGHQADDDMGMDIGPKTCELYKEALKDAKTVVWNGPMGVFEFPNFAAGTIAVAEELAQRYPEVFKYTKIWMDTIIHKTKKGEKEFGLSNTNKLIRHYNGCTGMKTGSTGEAGFCLSATATRNKIHMIAVVMGCESSKARIKDARTLLDYGFSNCQRIHSETTRKEIGRIPVQKGQRSEVSCQEKVTADLIDIKTQKGKIVKKIKIDSVKAPVKKGQKIGEIQYSKGNIMIHKEKILAQETINKADFLTQIKKISTQYFLILSHFL